MCRSPWASTSDPPTTGGSPSASVRMRSTSAGGRQRSVGSLWSLARGARDPIRHVGASIEVDRKHAVGVDRGQGFRRMQRAKKQSELFSDCERGRRRSAPPRRARRREGAARRRTARGSARSAPRRAVARESEPGAARRASAAPPALGARLAIAISRRGNRNAHRSSTTHTELSQPSPSSLAESSVELRKLLGEEGADERLVDHDVGIPLGHRSNLPC